MMGDHDTILDIPVFLAPKRGFLFNFICNFIEKPAYIWTEHRQEYP